MSREDEIQWLIYRELTRITARLDRLITGQAAIEEDVEELLPTPSAVSATLELKEN